MRFKPFFILKFPKRTFLFMRKKIWLFYKNCWFYPFRERYFCSRNIIIMIRQLFIILICLALGEIIVYFTGVKIPSSIIGMLLLTAGLQFKVIKLTSIQSIADFLLDNMVFFFIPPGVAIMCYFDLISKELLPILASIIGSTFLVLVSTSFTHQVLRKIRVKKLKKGKK